MTGISRDETQRNVDEILGRIGAAAARAGRSPESVTLIGVSKFQPVEAMYAAAACGIKIFGENRVRERAEKSAKWTGPPVAWHMIGHLQRNKARKAVELFDCVQSVDGVELASAIDRIAAEKNKSPYPVLLEINTSGEASKSGAPPEECFSLVEHVLTRCENLSPDGLMTIGPLTDDEREVRASFALLRDLAEGARRRFGIAPPRLSMGMTGDYEWAIEEGATIVRIGTGIFGARHI